MRHMLIGIGVLILPTNLRPQAKSLHIQPVVQSDLTAQPSFQLGTFGVRLFYALEPTRPSPHRHLLQTANARQQLPLQNQWLHLKKLEIQYFRQPA